MALSLSCSADSAACRTPPYLVVPALLMQHFQCPLQFQCFGPLGCVAGKDRKKKATEETTLASA